MRHSMKTTSLRCLLVTLSLLATVVVASCDDDGEVIQDPADFYLTVQFEQGFEPTAIDSLEVIISNAAVLLDEGEGELYEGGIIWEVRSGATGDEMVIAMTGDYVAMNTFPVPGDLNEIDVPFLGGLEGTETNFRFEVRGYWRDHEGALNQIGFGTATATFPLERNSSVTVEFACFNETQWGWTCRTGCDPAAQQCLSGDVSECGTGNYECIDGCCVPQD